MKHEVLDGLFSPKSIAVIGASNTKGKIGYTVVDNLIQSNYQGPVYPINPKDDEIQGFKAYPSVLDVPAEIDAAVVVIPAKFVPQVAKECGEKGVKGLLVISSGFSEVGYIDLELQVVEIARQYDMRVLGPNIVGVLSNSDNCNASFAPGLPLPGKAALGSQSGALLIAMDTASYTRRVGFDKMISIGNMSDVNFGDMIDWLNQDKKTTCISFYIEGLQNGQNFIRAARNARKPIIALKAGTSAHGAAAAASHTGSLAGSGKIYTSAFKQAGVVQAANLNNLFDRTQALSLQPPMEGNNLLIITNGGGVGVLATDAAEYAGLPLHFAPADLQAGLKKHMPSFGSAKNPVDMTGMAGKEWYQDSVQFALSHDWVDGVAVLYCETAMTAPLEIAKGIKAAIEAVGAHQKPIAVSFVGGKDSQTAMRWLVEAGIPAYDAPDAAVDALAALHEYAESRKLSAVKFKPFADVNEATAREIIAQVRAEGRTGMTEIESKDIFKAYGLPVADTRLATSEEKAVQLAEDVGYPIVMKIMSPDILHKSDAGGVKVDVNGEAAVREAYQTILANAKAYKAEADIRGIVVQEMAPWATEVILGSINDPTFGPTLMFGLGGIFVEILKDVTFRVAPVSPEQSIKMLDDIKGAPILKGARGEEPRDRIALSEVLSRYSQMIVDLGDEVNESDANPVLVYAEGKGVIVVDARIILKEV